MTPPQIAAERYLWGVALGLIPGLLYGFLRPLGRRRRALADVSFLIGAFPVWLYFSFAVCQGDLHLGYLSSLFLGGILFDCTAGRLFCLIWEGFWNLAGAFWGKWRKFFKKIRLFLKKTFASGKKSSTI